MNEKKKKATAVETGRKIDLVREKLLRDLERFFKEYSVREIGDTGLLITTKI